MSTQVPAFEEDACPLSGLAALHALDQEVLRDRAPAYRRAAGSGPVHWVEEFDAFLVLGRAEGEQVMDHPETFSNCIARGRGASVVEDEVRRRVVESTEMADLVARGYGRTVEVRAGLTADPPDHTRQRSLIAPAFRPRRIRSMEADIEQVASELLDGVLAAAAQGVVDLMPTWAGPFPLRVLAGVLGVPEGTVADYGRWSEGLLLPVGRASVTDAELAEMVECRREFDRFFADQLLDRAKRPRDDFLSDFVGGALGGPEGGARTLSLDEMLAIIEQFVIAGHETTTRLMASAMVHLMEDPPLLAQLRDDPARTDAFIDEVLRLEAPSQLGTRQALVDTELGGVSIPAGAAVTVLWAASNRDPAEFEAPDLLDLDRANRGSHGSFGRGIHFCVGHALARTEMRIGLRQLAERVESLAFVDPRGRAALPYSPSFMLHGPSAVPAVVVPREHGAVPA